MFSKIYLGLGAVILSMYTGMALTGYEFGTPQRQLLPQEARHAGGYRSFHFWHSGYRGGK